MNDKRRDLAFDLLKLLACLSVIIIHIVPFVLNKESINSTKFIIANIYTVITRWCVPIFIMITGAFMLGKKEALSLKVLFTKYILRIFIIYFIFSLFYQLVYLYLDDNFVLNIKVVLNIFIEILTGNGFTHLWYLYMLIGIYLLYPIIYKVTRKITKKDLEYTLIILFILSTVVTSLNELFSILLLNYRISVSINISIYVFYFIAGYYLYNFKINKWLDKLLCWCVPISIIFSLILNFISVYTFNRNNTLFIESSSINIVMLSLGVFWLVKRYFSRWKFIDCFSKIINFGSEYFLGIYLIHLLFVDCLYRLEIIRFDSIFTVIIIPVYSLLVYMISLCFLLLVKWVCKVFNKPKQIR